MENFVAIKQYSNSYEADIVKGLLESHDIDVVLERVHSIDQMQPTYYLPSPQLLVKVRKDSMTFALELLESQVMNSPSHHSSIAFVVKGTPFSALGCFLGFVSFSICIGLAYAFLNHSIFLTIFFAVLSITFYALIFIKFEKRAKVTYQKGICSHCGQSALTTAFTCSHCHREFVGCIEHKDKRLVAEEEYFETVKEIQS